MGYFPLPILAGYKHHRFLYLCRCNSGIWAVIFATPLVSTFGGLTKWLTAKFIAMLAVFILTVIELIILGFPMWLTLALLAGILNIVPNLGPIAAMVPAVLIGLAINPTTALVVATMYNTIQLVESTLINPKTQQCLIKISLTLIILSHIFVGAINGIWGVVFATPLVLIIIILVQALYVQTMIERT